jgi:hypothetical protein
VAKKRNRWLRREIGGYEGRWVADIGRLTLIREMVAKRRWVDKFV